MTRLPISEYPEVVPPSVQVTAQFPGANPETVADTVATPLEEQINGVENMLYMQSQAASDGTLTLTVTFKLGTDPNLATQLVQNRVNQALPRLPDVTRNLGVTTVKSSPDLTMVVHLLSPDDRYDMLYLRNYATLNVKDQLAKIEGIGSVQLFGSGDYAMRIWLNPQKIAELGLSADDVVTAVRRQNVQVAAGVVNGPPYSDKGQLQLPINVEGRLSDPEEFGRDRHQEPERRGDPAQRRRAHRNRRLAIQPALAARQQAGGCDPDLPGAGLERDRNFQSRARDHGGLEEELPGRARLQHRLRPDRVRARLIKAVVHTLLEAVALVVLVVILFLQTWRASIIPLLAVPTSIIGTFAAMYLFGFSINALSLFGLVLAIGIVVDDAIVVVENVERNIEAGLHPREATMQAMSEVTGPIIAIALVLCAVFVPIAFISGLTGEFYRQFALTIAFSTIISAFNSLTLSPALSALLLKGHDAPKDALARGMDKVLGPFFRGFNRVFLAGSSGYSHGVRNILSHKAIAVGIYVVLLAMTVFVFRAVPPGFVPLQDKQYLVSFAQLPQGATLERTEKVIRDMSDIAMREPGVQSAVSFPGLSINGFINSPSAGIVFVTLKPFEERTTPDLSGFAISQKLQMKYAGIRDATIAIFPPPPVNGLGQIAGFKLQVEDRTDQGDAVLARVMGEIQGRAAKTPGLFAVFSNFNIGVPQLHAHVDRTKAMQLGVEVQDIFDTMQTYLGSIYVNDFNRFGRTYEVIAQADMPFRTKVDDILRLQVRNASGQMVPLGAVVNVEQTTGPDSSVRYNGFRSADLNGAPAPGYSSGQAQAAITQILDETLPKGMQLRMDRSDLSGDSRRQYRDPGVSALRAAGLPGARRAI